MASEEAKDEPKTVYRLDYKPPPYVIRSVHLTFDLEPEATVVTAKFSVARDAAHCPGGASQRVELDGDGLETLSVVVGGKELTPEGKDEAGYSIATTRSGSTLSFAGSLVPEGDAGVDVETKVRFSPKANLALMGLYISNGLYCTQCEAMGFRRITWFVDRPDNLATYTVLLRGDKAANPVMLSNGNLVEEGELEDGRHTRLWVDPYPKPSYLFALVAGKLGFLEDTFTTMEGRTATIRAWGDDSVVPRLKHALGAVSQAMKWDEDRFGRAYDLDFYNIVAVEDFNQGAMENKSLNIFNTVALVGDPETTTDERLEYITGVVGHEFFHNWSGNRVTVRDWFQLTLKEGFTKFRDGWFSMDTFSSSFKRITDVKRLQESQFAEDAGPMAHPIRPDSYISFDSYYTVTVYWKGAEVHRMYLTILGYDTFRRATDTYFSRYDGKAVSCDEMRACMAEASGRDMEQFDRWFSQAGTPTVTATSVHDAAAGTYTLTLKQSVGDTPSQPASEKKPFLIPVAVGLMDAATGADTKLTLAEGSPETATASDLETDTTKVLLLSETEQTWTFTGVGASRPVLSLNRNFTAPIKTVHEQQTQEDLECMMAHDSDDVNRWAAADKVSMDVCVDIANKIAAAGGKTEGIEVPERFVAAFRSTLTGEGLDSSLKAIALVLPEVSVIADATATYDPVVASAARAHVKGHLSRVLAAEFKAAYAGCEIAGAYTLDQEQVGARRLRNLCLGYLATNGDAEAIALAKAQFDAASCMTDSVGALGALADHDCPEATAALEAFEKKWSHDPLVMDTWLGIQATSSRPGTLARVRELMKHPCFTLKNPNKVRALVGGFVMRNLAQFHAADGAGYALLGDVVREIDAFNGMIAARYAGAISNWKRFDEGRQALMKAQLEAMRDREGCSKDVFEITTKCLA